MSRKPFAWRSCWPKPALLIMIIAVTSVAAICSPSARADEESFVSLGTGELNGVYYPVGKAICEVVNRDLRTHGVRCSPETTPGSVYNIEALRSV